MAQGSSYTEWQSGLIFVGRVLISAIFIMSGCHKLMHWTEMAQFLKSMMIPLPFVMLTIALLLEIIGGFFVLLGYKARLGALLLLIFLLPVTLIMHAFWNASSLEVQTQSLMFWKNMAIIGGLFTLIGSGPGNWSLD